MPIDINLETNDSILNECTEYKRLYDKCFNNWFANKYIQGSNDMSECSSDYLRYMKCVEKIIHYKDPLYVRVLTEIRNRPS